MKEYLVFIKDSGNSIQVRSSKISEFLGIEQYNKLTWSEFTNKINELNNGIKLPVNYDFKINELSIYTDQNDFVVYIDGVFDKILNNSFHSIYNVLESYINTNRI